MKVNVIINSYSKCPQLQIKPETVADTALLALFRKGVEGKTASLAYDTGYCSTDYDSTPVGPTGVWLLFDDPPAKAKATSPKSVGAIEDAMNNLKPGEFVVAPDAHALSFKVGDTVRERRASAPDCVMRITGFGGGGKLAACETVKDGKQAGNFHLEELEHIVVPGANYVPPPTSPEPFAVGDVVRLKSGGPCMTVTGFDAGGDAICWWWSFAECGIKAIWPPHKQVFPQAALERAPKATS